MQIKKKEKNTPLVDNPNNIRGYFIAVLRAFNSVFIETKEFKKHLEAQCVLLASRKHKNKCKPIAKS